MSISTVPQGFEMVNIVGTDLVDPDDCELILVRAPKGIDISKLHGKKFSSKRVKQIEVDDTVGELKTLYELTPFQGEFPYFNPKVLDQQPVVTADGQTRLGPELSGLLSITKSYTSKESDASTLPSSLHSSESVSMPEGLKVRFQPFGAGEPVKTPRVRKKSKKHHDKDQKSSKKRKSGYSSNPELSSKKRKKCHDISDEEDAFMGDGLLNSTGGIDRLCDTLPNDSSIFMPNGETSPTQVHRKGTSSSGYSTADTTLNFSGVNGKGSGKKKKHKKEKRHKFSTQ